jgi:translation initiation factor IF-1
LKPVAEKEAKIEVDVEVLEHFKSGMFRIVLENGHQTLGYIAGKLRPHRIRILPGDKVKLELSPTTCSEDESCTATGNRKRAVSSAQKRPRTARVANRAGGYGLARVCARLSVRMEVGGDRFEAARRYGAVPLHGLWVRDQHQRAASGVPDVPQTRLGADSEASGARNAGEAVNGRRTTLSPACEIGAGRR